MQIRILRWPDDQEALFHYFERVYGPEEQNTISAWYGTYPGFVPADAFVVEAEPDGDIVGHALLIPRALQIGEAVLPAAEIALADVDESHHKQGIERALLEIAHERLDAREAAVSLTLGLPNSYEHWQYDYAAGLYLTSFEPDISLDLAQKAGSWDSLHTYERRTADRLGAHSQSVIVRPFYASDLPTVQALYAAESARGSYLIARDEAQWLWQMDYLIHTGRYEPDDFLVAEIDNRLVAYVRVISHQDVNWFRGADAAHFSVIEAAGDHADGVEALLAEVARMAERLDVERIGLFVPHDSAFMAHALARGASLRTFTGAAYLRLHDLPLALSHLAPALEERRLNSRYTGRAYRLAITTEHDEVAVDLGMGSPETVELEIPSTSLMRLITGWYGIDHLTTGYHERYHDLLAVLFPRRRPMIGIADLL
ncbi:GNAT family N-acetyltransferase [Aggregatilinea lenta]|uniref:GNAT family N-acetyltransferase n=1 Tax=Aggregatilinea lenta TaxID=913108 RepID=UPI000E5BDC58|nr:GNAT family N-acetyltransferase [Aggregatilinea lenta]